MHFNRIKKVISLITLIAFICSNTAYGAPSSRSLFRNKKVDYKKLSTQREETLSQKKAIFQEQDDKKEERRKEAQRVLSTHLQDLSQIHIPAEYGRVIEVYDASEDRVQRTEDRLIVHIQDLHTNPEAELNLANILEILVKDYNLDLVCSEGADGVVDTSSVSSFPDYEVREKTARLFINSGELTGEEYLSITKYPDLPIWGVEDKDIYFQNIIEFNRIMKFSPQSQQFISQAKKALEELKPKIYSKELLEVDKKELDYEDKKIETDEYLDYLVSYIQKFNIPVDKYKNISILTQSMKKEKEIDNIKIMQESQNLLLNLQAELSRKDLRKEIDSLTVKAELFKDKKISPFSFYSYLKDLALKYMPDKFTKYMALNDFIDYLTKVNSLDSTKLFVEMQDLTYEVKQRLSKNEEQKTLVKALRNINFLEGFFNLKVSNEELDCYLENRETHKVGWFKETITNLTNKTNSTSSTNYIDFNPGYIDPHLQELEDFYKTVKDRDVAMVDNSINEIERRNAKVATLISGGFHTKGITRLLRDKGYSYIVVSPYSSTDIDEENYHFLLSGRRKPLEELLSNLSGTLRVIESFATDAMFYKWNDDIVYRVAEVTGQDPEELKLEKGRHRFWEALLVVFFGGELTRPTRRGIAEILSKWSALQDLARELGLSIKLNESANTFVFRHRDALTDKVMYSRVRLKAGGEPILEAVSGRLFAGRMIDIAGVRVAEAQALAALGQRVNQQFTEEQRQEIIDAARTILSMLPEGTELLTTSDVIDKIRETNVANIDRAELQTQDLEVPPTFVFSGEDLHPQYRDSNTRFVAVTVDRDFVAVNAVSSVVKDDNRVLAKGGVRWYQEGAGNLRDLTLEDKLRGKNIVSLLQEAVRLAYAMWEKNATSNWFDGGKTNIVARRDVDKLEALRRWVRSSVTTNMLLHRYIAGPDMGTGEAEVMSAVVDEADKVQTLLDYTTRYRDEMGGRGSILATTSRTPEQGSFSHVLWTVTSITVVETMLSALERLQKELEIGEDEVITVAIQGYGDVGSGIIAVLHRMMQDEDLKSQRRALLNRIRIVAVSDISGAIYNEEGLNIDELLRIRNAWLQTKAMPRVVDDYQGEARRMPGIKEGPAPLFLGATVVIPAAIPNVITSADQIDVKTKLIVEGANNAMLAGVELDLSNRGVIVFTGPIANMEIARGDIILDYRRQAGLLGPEREKVVSATRVTKDIDPAARLFLSSGQRTDEPRWLKLQIVLRAALTTKENITATSIQSRVNDLMRRHNAIHKGSTIGTKEVTELLEELTGAGLMLKTEHAQGIFYRVSDPRASAIWADDMEYIGNEIVENLGDKAGLRELLLQYEAACETLWADYPVEAFYPVLKAVSKLDKRSQDRLIQRIAEFEQDDGQDFYRHRIFDAIRLELLPSSDIHEDWLKRYAPNLAGRTIVIVAAEISRMAGGLGRVVNYHTTEMLRLAGQHAKCVWVEPYYRDFEEIKDIELVEEFEVAVGRGKRKVKAQVYKRTKVMAIPNEKGEIEEVEIENFLIRDKDGYYIANLYKYGAQYGSVTLEEFSEFFSKAVLEFTRRQASRAKESQGRQGWKDVLLNPHDGQCLPVAFWKRLNYGDDPLMSDIPVAGITHTYLNRGMWDFGSVREARSKLDIMGIPREYQWYFLRRGHDGRIIVDLTSSGVRTSHVVSGVSRMHAFEVNLFDAMRRLFGITNGDLRTLSTKVFQRILRTIHGENVDVEDLTPAQIGATKIKAKIELKELLKKKVAVGHVYGDINLHSRQMVINYLGRLAPEKWGITIDNIREMVRAGAQVVIFGHVIEGYGASEAIGNALKALAREIKKDKEGLKQGSDYKGTLVFVDEFNLDDQAVLLAATDLQAQVSRRGTGACEYTESDATANGALHLGPPWIEGIIQMQGVILDRTIPGSGNTIVPYDNTEMAYREAFMWAIELYNKKRQDYAKYQATSVRLSRILEARNTAAAYLRTWDRILGDTEVFDTALEARNTAMTEAGVKLRGVHIESLSHELDYGEEADIIETDGDSIEVEAVLRLAPGVAIPEVKVRTTAASSPDKDKWTNYPLELVSFDGHRAVYRGKVPVHLEREDVLLTWQVGDAYLGNERNNAEIRIVREDVFAAAGGETRVTFTQEPALVPKALRVRSVSSSIKTFGAERTGPEETLYEGPFAEVISKLLGDGRQTEAENLQDVLEIVRDVYSEIREVQFNIRIVRNHVYNIAEYMPDTKTFTKTLMIDELLLDNFELLRQELVSEEFHHMLYWHLLADLENRKPTPREELIEELVTDMQKFEEFKDIETAEERASLLEPLIRSVDKYGFHRLLIRRIPKGEERDKILDILQKRGFLDRAEKLELSALASFLDDTELQLAALNGHYQSYRVVKDELQVLVSPERPITLDEIDEYNTEFANLRNRYTDKYNFMRIHLGEVIIKRGGLFGFRDVIGEPRYSADQQEVTLVNEDNGKKLRISVTSEDGTNYVKIGQRTYKAGRQNMVDLSRLLTGDPLLWIGNHELLEFSNRTIQDILAASMPVRGPTSSGVSIYLYDELRDPISRTSQPELIAYNPSKEELSRAREILSSRPTWREDGESLYERLHNIAILAQSNYTIEGLSYEQAIEDKLLVSNQLEQIIRTSKDEDMQRLAREVLSSISLLAIREEPDRENVFEIGLTEREDKKLRDKDPFEITSAQASDEEFKRLNDIFSHAMSEGRIKPYFLISIANFTADTFLAYSTFLRDISRKYNGNVTFLLSLEPVAVDIAGLDRPYKPFAHDMPGALVGRRRVIDTFGKDFYTGEPLIDITDGGKKTRAANATVRYEQWSKVSNENGLSFLENNMLTGGTMLLLLPEHGKGIRLWLASDGRIKFGKINIGGRPLSQLPDDFQIAACGPERLVMTADQRRELQGLIRKYGWEAAKRKPAFHVLWPKILSNISIQKLEQRGIFDTDENGIMEVFLEKPKDLEELVRVAMTNPAPDGSGVVTENLFLVVEQADVSYGLVVDLSKTRIPSDDRGYFERAKIKVSEEEPSLSEHEVAIKTHGRAQIMAKVDRVLARSPVSIFQTIYQGFLSGKSSPTNDIVRRHVQKMHGISYGEGNIVGDIGDLEQNFLMWDAYIRAYEGPKEDNFQVSGDVRIEYQGDKEELNYLLRNVEIKGKGVLRISEGVLIQDSTIEVDGKLIIPESTKIIDSNLKGGRYIFHGEAGVVMGVDFEPGKILEVGFTDPVQELHIYGDETLVHIQYQDNTAYLVRMINSMPYKGRKISELVGGYDKWDRIRSRFSIKEDDFEKALDLPLSSFCHSVDKWFELATLVFSEDILEELLYRVRDEILREQETGSSKDVIVEAITDILYNIPSARLTETNWQTLSYYAQNIFEHISEDSSEEDLLDLIRDAHQNRFTSQIEIACYAVDYLFVKGLTYGEALFKVLEFMHPRLLGAFKWDEVRDLEFIQLEHYGGGRDSEQARLDVAALKMQERTSAARGIGSTGIEALPEVEEIASRKQVDRAMDEIVVVASYTIQDINAFIRRLPGVSRKKAVVVIAGDVDEYMRIQELKDYVHIKVANISLDEAERLGLEPYQIITLEEDEIYRIFNNILPYGMNGIGLDMLTDKLNKDTIDEIGSGV